MKIELRGFTLVELVITIAIVVILSMISAPLYNSYLKKTKMAEGYALLKQICNAEILYYNERRNFLYAMDNKKVYSSSGSYTQFDPLLGVDARTNQYFKEFTIMWGGSGCNYHNFSASAKSSFGTLKLVYDITAGKAEYSFS